MKFNGSQVWEINQILKGSFRFACFFFCFFFSSILKHFLAFFSVFYEIFYLFWKKTRVTLDFFFPVEFNFFYKNFCFKIRLNQLIEYEHVLYYFLVCLSSCRSNRRSFSIILILDFSYLRFYQLIWKNIDVTLLTL